VLVVTVANGSDGRALEPLTRHIEPTMADWKAPMVICGVNINAIKEPGPLHQLLQQCEDFDDKNKIFARLMSIMPGGSDAQPSLMTRPESNKAKEEPKPKRNELELDVVPQGKGAKEVMLFWVQCRLRGYKTVKMDNFSTCWADGIAFCALIHHFFPDAFDFSKLDPRNRRYNFDLAFRTAEQRAGIFPLLEPDDLVAMDKPDWKSVFAYIQSIYAALK